MPNAMTTAPATTQTRPAVETLSFEAALDELQKIVGDLETGKAPLEESIAAYERGIALKNHCERKLQEAQAKIEKINVNADGSLSASAAALKPQE
jgi:exodeoxyribonuclease VII small subunit